MRAALQRWCAVDARRLAQGGVMEKRLLHEVKRLMATMDCAGARRCARLQQQQRAAGSA